MARLSRPTLIVVEPGSAPVEDMGDGGDDEARKPVAVSASDTNTHYGAAAHGHQPGTSLPGDGDRRGTPAPAEPTADPSR